MSTISNNAKLAYIYDQPTDSWYPVAGVANQSANYSWSGTHSFGATTTFQSVLSAKAGINNFLNPTARDTAIPSPVNGITCFVQQENSGTIINQLQYYYNGWKIYGDNAILAFKTASFTLSLNDAGKTVDIDSATPVVVTIPLNSSAALPIGAQIAFYQYGAGEVSFAAGDAGITIVSKNGNKKISSRYSSATLVKRAENTWVLIGDLKA